MNKIHLNPRGKPWLVVTIAAVLLFGIASTILPVAAQSPDTIQVERQVSPTSGVMGNVDFQVTLTLTGDVSQCAKTLSQKPSDIILALDRSGSMSEDAGGGISGSKMDALKRSATAFLTKVDLKKDQVGIVEFETAADVAHALTDDRGLLDDTIAQIDPAGLTAIDQGVVIAHRELLSDRARNDANHVIILITDGIPEGPFTSEDSARTAAQDAQADGIRIITIGLGDNADQNLLREMASQESDAYFAPNGSDLDRIYTTIAQSVKQPASASDVVFEHTVDTTALEVIGESIEPKGVLNGNKISWAIKNVLDKPVVLSYRAKPRNPGAFQIDRGDTIQYNRCETDARTLSIPLGLPVSVQAPPTNTPTPSLTPKPTLGPTFTPLPPPPRLACAFGCRSSMSKSRHRFSIVLAFDSAFGFVFRVVVMASDP